MKNKVLIVLCILFASISIVEAEIIYNAKDIVFNSKNSNWQVNDVETAINNLYDYRNDILKDNTVTPDKILKGYIAHDANGKKITGTINSLEGNTYYPGKENIEIEGNQYLAYKQIISSIRPITITLQFGNNTSANYTNQQNRIYLSPYKDIYKYFKITRASKADATVGSCTGIYLNNISDSFNGGNLELNKTYNIDDYNIVIAYTSGTTYCFYQVDIELFN